MHTDATTTVLRCSDQLGCRVFHRSRRRRYVVQLLEAGAFADLVGLEAFGGACLLLRLILGALRRMDAICAATKSINRLGGS